MNEQHQTNSEEILLVNILIQRIIDLGYDVQLNEEELILIINDQLQIEFRIIRNPNYAKELIHLMVNTVHPIHFSEGIMESLVGIGITLEERIISAIDNYITSTFIPISESLTDTHSPEYDFMSDSVLWHPTLSDLRIQGEYNQEVKGDELYLLLVDKLETVLNSNQKFHWLKMYISKQKSGEIIGDCLLDNEPWDNGLEILSDYISKYKVLSEFIGIKQFVVFRRCDKYDNTLL
ncbi:DUF6348 family protein [Myroides sp.]|uniref:DUF6348 family protein n=1 Tax=Myroides sp. TaxID=1874736 RepID=UPI003F2D80A1